MTELGAITIISGGQTGADRAALDYAIGHGLTHGGWCPRGRLAEDGPLEARYQLEETPSRNYAQRTEWNVRDSDATVVFSIRSQVSGGTALTIELAERLGKAWLHLARDAGPTCAEHASKLREFVLANDVARLNVAGPRASQEPAIAGFVAEVLGAAFGSR